MNIALRIKLLFLVVFVFMFVSVGSAQVPQKMNYEGTLTDTEGNPVPDGTYEIQFSLYSVLTGGTPLWTEAWNSTTAPVIVTNGKFNVMLGAHNPIPVEFFNERPTVYLGIKVGTDDEMLPRQQLASVAYAFTAGSGGIPKGGVIMWSGSKDAIPSGWALCDGNNGTPDLRNRFIVGAGSDYTVGATGGTLSSNLAHSHTVNNHTHHIDVNITNCNGDCVDKRKKGSDETGSEDHRHRLIADTQGSAPGTDTQLDGGTVDNRPPYYALCFIMKL